MGLPIESVKSNRISLIVDVDTGDHYKILVDTKMESYELDYQLVLQQWC